MESQLGACIVEHRRTLGLTPQKLAAMIGYRNLAKGANRIQALERGAQAHDNLLAKIASAMHLDAVQVHELAEADRRARDEAWQAWADEPVAPELRVRVMPVIWCRVPLPVALSRAGAENFASARAVETRMTHMIIWSRREEVWCYPDARTLTRTVAIGAVAGPSMRLRGRGGRTFLFG